LPRELHVRAQAMDTHMMLAFVRQGLGAGLVPQAQIAGLKAQIPEIRHLQGKAPVSNRIRVAYLRKRTMGLAAKLCVQWLSERMAQPQT